MLFSQVLRCLPAAGFSLNLSGADSASVEILGITHSTEDVRPGWLFIAVPGRKTDGHAFIGKAIELGAVAVLGELGAAALSLPPHIAYAQTVNARKALGLLASELNGRPSEFMGVIGVTGTDGKTTTTNLIAAIFDAAGFTTGFTTTIDWKIGDKRFENNTRFTNLEAPELQSLMAQMRDSGVQYAIIESTSSGLELERLAGIQYDTAVVTNITSEHIEVHGSKEQYWRAKAMLFERTDASLAEKSLPFGNIPRACALNADDSSYAFLSRYCRAPIISYGVDNPGAHINAKNVTLRSDGSEFDVVFPNGQTAHIRSALMARFNVSNILAAIAVSYSHHIPPEAIERAIAAYPGTSGRMETIREGQDFTVIVDYAHTAESLRLVLATLRPLTKGKLIAVFGSAGDRDHTKRPEMGEVAAEYADFFVITDEDPRTEDAAAILREIAAGSESAGAVEGRDFIMQVGRKEGIAYAFDVARAGDVVVLCGKGHEQSIIIGTEKLPWDDRVVARELLQNRR